VSRVFQLRVTVPASLAGAGDELSTRLSPTRILERMGLTPDPWQRTVLVAEGNLLLNCHRQGGKSTVVGVKAIHTAVYRAGSLTLVVSRSLRQSSETFRKALDAYYALRDEGAAIRRRSLLSLELANGSRIVALPGREDTIRGFSSVQLLIIDEAARVPDDLYRAVRPMLAVSRGQVICLSTPFGQRGFFWKEWTGSGPWRRIQVAADECPRLTKDFLDDELRALGRSWFEQEYFNSFTATEGLVYPDFALAVIDPRPVPEGRKVGGIDWGWHAPFAAVWGVHDPQTDILYVTGERYQPYTSLSDHCEALKRHGCIWTADSAGATEINAFRAAGLTVERADKDVRAGIAAVTARLQTGRLKVFPSCTNLLREASLYRYPDETALPMEAEKPVNKDNHALDALRYLVSRLDRRFMAKARRRGEEKPDPGPARPERRWMDWENEGVWES
jgi:hypothetical protein